VTSSERFLSGSFLRYWRADAVSVLGTYVTLFALQALVVLTLDGSAADVGWLNAARWLPYLVFGLVVGAIVDGRRRLPLMVSTDLLQAALLLTIPLLWFLGLLSLPALLLIVLVIGTASVINVAAAMSLLPRLSSRSTSNRPTRASTAPTRCPRLRAPRSADCWSPRSGLRWPSSWTR